MKMLLSVELSLEPELEREVGKRVWKLGPDPELDPRLGLATRLQNADPAMVIIYTSFCVVLGYRAM
jgi:hypothetical protein